jgi:hypothetical protein
MRSGQIVQKKKHVSNEDLEDTGTSPITPSEAVASNECHVIEDNALPTNLASPVHNQRHIQSSENRASTHCDVLQSGIGGIHKEVNASVQGKASINTHDPLINFLQEIAAHPVPSFLTRQ